MDISLPLCPAPPAVVAPAGAAPAFAALLATAVEVGTGLAEAAPQGEAVPGDLLASAMPVAAMLPAALEPAVPEAPQAQVEPAPGAVTGDEAVAASAETFAVPGEQGAVIHPDVPVHSAPLPAGIPAAPFESAAAQPAPALPKQATPIGGAVAAAERAAEPSGTPGATTAVPDRDGRVENLAKATTGVPGSGVPAGFATTPAEASGPAEAPGKAQSEQAAPAATPTSAGAPDARPPPSNQAIPTGEASPPAAASPASEAGLKVLSSSDLPAAAADVAPRNAPFLAAAAGSGIQPRAGRAEAGPPAKPGASPTTAIEGEAVPEHRSATFSASRSAPPAPQEAGWTSVEPALAAAPVHGKSSSEPQVAPALPTEIQARPGAEAILPPSPAAAPPPPETPAPPQRAAAPISWPARQVAPFAVALALGPDARVTLTLEPAELGQVEVSIERSGDAASVRIVAERPETLALLQRDGRELERALQAAGIGERETNLSFSLGGDTPREAPDRGGARQPRGRAPAAEPFASPHPQPSLARRGLIDLAL